MAAAVVLAVVASTWLLVRGFDQPARSDMLNDTLGDRPSDGPNALSAAREIRVAVLPLENLSPDPGDAFFAAGMHEEIIGALARLPGIKVVSRTTMLTYRDAPAKPLATIAQESGATHLIEGSVRRAAQRVRLSIQLIEAHTDEHLWAQTYDRMLESAREHRLLLRAQADAFLGDRGRAIVAARSLNDVSPRCVGGCRIHFQATRAAIFAWSGAEDDAVRELETLSAGVPSPGPALIAKDPLYTIPLQQNAHFRQLVSRLEARMLEVKNELRRHRTSVQ